MACGSGKTLTAHWINQFLKFNKTLVFVPSLYLLTQFYKDWYKQSHVEDIKINFLLIGSNADINDEEMNLNANKINIFTDQNAIKKYLITVKADEKIVVISTYQSAEILAGSCKKIKFEFDFGIFDEVERIYRVDYNYKISHNNFIYPIP